MDNGKPKRYSGSFKQEVVETMLAEKLSYCETAVRFNTTDKSVSEWTRIYLEEGPESLHQTRRNKARRTTKPKPSKRVERDIIAENEYLRAENDYLKNLHALVSKQGQGNNGHK